MPHFSPNQHCACDRAGGEPLLHITFWLPVKHLTQGVQSCSIHVPISHVRDYYSTDILRWVRTLGLALTQRFSPVYLSTAHWCSIVGDPVDDDEELRTQSCCWLQYGMDDEKRIVSLDALILTPNFGDNEVCKGYMRASSLSESSHLSSTPSNRIAGPSTPNSPHQSASSTPQGLSSSTTPQLSSTRSAHRASPGWSPSRRAGKSNRDRRDRDACIFDPVGFDCLAGAHIIPYHMQSSAPDRWELLKNVLCPEFSSVGDPRNIITMSSAIHSRLDEHYITILPTSNAPAYTHLMQPEHVPGGVRRQIPASSPRVMLGTGMILQYVGNCQVLQDTLTSHSVNVVEKRRQRYISVSDVIARHYQHRPLHNLSATFPPGTMDVQLPPYLLLAYFYALDILRYYASEDDLEAMALAMSYNPQSVTSSDSSLANPSEHADAPKGDTPTHGARPNAFSRDSYNQTHFTGGGGSAADCTALNHHNILKFNSGQNPWPLARLQAWLKESA